MENYRVLRGKAYKKEKEKETKYLASKGRSTYNSNWEFSSGM